MTARAPVAAGPHEGLLALLARLWRLLGPRRRRQFRLLMLLVIASALAEVVSLGAVLPFLAVLASPEAAFAHPFGTAVATRLGITSPQGLMLPLTLAFVVAALVSGAIRLLLLKASTRFAFGTGSELSIEVYRRTLYQPYSVHVSRNSSQVISGITQKVGGTTMGVLMPTVTFISSGVAILALMLALIAINPAVALVATACFGLSYAAITWRARRRLRRNSVLIAREQTELVKALQEGLGGIRDVLLDGTQAVYCEAYGRADHQLRRAQGANVYIAQSPRYSIEALGMVLIAVLAYALSRQAGGLAPALPLLGALAIGAQRLLPSLQQAFSAWANIAGNQGVLRDSLELLEQPVARELASASRAIAVHALDPLRSHPVPLLGEEPMGDPGTQPRDPERRAHRVRRQHGRRQEHDARPADGTADADRGRDSGGWRAVRGERVRAWQRTLAHVPQSIFLADSTLAENIAFGVPRDAIDSARVHDAAERAQLARFIENHPEGYDAMVGERGIRLSGGQRQRIGIARALYKNASVLVLDEATSALDNVTEQSVLDAIDALDRELTILLIAHRLTTVRRCDVIIELEQGAIVAQGTYEELLERSPSFRRMVESTRIN